MSRDNLYLVIGAAVFVAAFLLLYLMTDLSLWAVTAIAFLLSIASDVLIVIDNELRNAAPDAKWHQRNELVGEAAVVTGDFGPEHDAWRGPIEVRGEKWIVRSGDPGLKSGDRVRIIERTGMIFTVKKIPTADSRDP